MKTIDKYPKARAFLLQSGMTVDEALEFLKKELREKNEK